MTNIKIISAVIWLLLSFPGYAYNPGNPEFDPAVPENINNIGCVYVESDGEWVVANCDYKGAHSACYNGSNWRIAQAIGTAEAEGIPIDGTESPILGESVKSVDSWNAGRADARCKDLFGPSYFFSVPTTDEENSALHSVLQRDLSVQVRRTWIHYYSNDEEVPQNANFWFGNRSAFASVLIDHDGSDETPPLKLFDADNKGKNLSTADCTVLDRVSGRWEDVSCDSEFAYACFVGGDWEVVTEIGDWRSGYAKCDQEDDVQSLYAVPRDDAENDELQQALQSVYAAAVGDDEKSKYEKVWLNYSDLVFEEFFVANQRRKAWWAESQPTNRRNADCTLMNNKGQWISESCDKYEAYHVCQNEGQWSLTKDIPDFNGKSAWAYGFGYCKRLNNSEFVPPVSESSYKALKDMAVATLSDDELVWINYSDQDNEGAWKAENQYQDFVSFDSVSVGDNKDCGFYSNQTGSEANWETTECFRGDSRGFACTNGYEWKITDFQDDLWKAGFSQCKSFGSDYFYAAPSSADQNSRLGAALSLSGLTDVWINLNDAESEGTWVANGPIVNLSPVVELRSGLEFNEKEVMSLSVEAFDPEDEGDLTYFWEKVGVRVGGEGLDIVEEPGLLDEDTKTVSIGAVDLLNDPYFIDLKLQVTDNALEPSTTTLFYTVIVSPPLKAAYSFDSYTNPGKDLTGNGHDIALSQDTFEIRPHLNSFSDYFVQLDSTEVFTIAGSGDNGLIVGELTPEEIAEGKLPSYTVIYRFKLDEDPDGALAGFMQKGSGSTRQPAVFYEKDSHKIQATNTTSFSPIEDVLSNELVRLGQWMTVAYVKEGPQIRMYIDKAEQKLDDPLDLQNTPDAFRNLDGVSEGFSNGDWAFGNVPGAGEGINGGFDDIRIYNRALLPSELTWVFKDQPKGRFEFTVELADGDESEVDSDVNEIEVSVERIEGDEGVVNVGYKLLSGSAELNTDFKLKDNASGNGEGTLQWVVHDRAPKKIYIEIIGDSLREGTESFTLQLEQLSAEPGIASRSLMTVNIADKTPNPYGVFAIAPGNAPVEEGDDGSVMIERSGTDTLKDYKVLYEVHETSAKSPADFSITAIDPDVSFIVENDPLTTLVGAGEIIFLGNTSTTVPVTSTIKGISFSSVSEDGLENNEFFTVGLLDIQDLAGNSVIGSPTDAILGTTLGYQQALTDVTPGRVSFAAASFADVYEDDGVSSASIVLERRDGDDGTLCVDLSFGSGSANHIDDFTISYGGASAGSGTTSVIFWDDQDDTDKTIILTAVDDNVFESNETIQLEFSENFGCGENAPDAAVLGDFESATINIFDVTDAAELSFLASEYEISERASHVEITVQNTGNVNNAFKVYLTRNDSGTGAVSGRDYKALSDAEAVISFDEGDTEIVFELPIIDNCVGSPTLAFTVGLSKEHEVLNGQNLLPLDKIAIVGNVANVIIEDAYPEEIDVTTAIDLSGLTNPAPNVGGRYRVTNSEFTAAEMKYLASNHTDDECFLNYQWSLASTTPSLPTGGTLPGNFSSGLVISGTSEASDSFQLPFVVDNTRLKVRLTATHPEAGAVIIDNNLDVGAYWRRLRVDGDECAEVKTGDNHRVNNTGTCSAGTNRNFVYNKVTSQIVGQAKYGGNIGCWQEGGNVDFRACDSDNNQKFEFKTHSPATCNNIQELLTEDGTNVVEEYIGSEIITDDSPNSSRCGERTWAWIGNP